MNIILVSKEEVVDNKVIVDDNRAGHIVEVLKCREGDVVRVGMINGRKGTGKILGAKNGRSPKVELLLDLNEELAPIPPIDLLIALPRPIMLKRILSQAAALGCGSITLINANRVEKSFWQASLLDERAYRPHLLHGLEQAVDTRLPEIRSFKRFKPFVEDVLPTMMHGYSHCILAHPGDGLTVKEALTGTQGRVLLAIGPEGGWIDYEVEKFLTRGFSLVSMGKRILKVDTAVISLHARVSAILE
jgi:RsmE family RNA methyltransferase